MKQKYKKILSIFRARFFYTSFRRMNGSTVTGRTGLLSEKWIKAAVIGSIWAAIEIIAGSFLHNLRIPFSGTTLSMVAVFMLVGFSMHWKERGIFIRAGLIAALMKSISPSAVIFGPMMAIFMEGLLLELVWLLFGRNLLAYMLGGMFAVSWALAQKVITLLILYGFDLVVIAEAFYQFLVQKTGLGHVAPIYLVLLVLAIYYLAGMLAALGGYFSYKRLQKRSIITGEKMNVRKIHDPFGSRDGRQAYTALNLILILVVLAASLYLLNNRIYLVAGILGGGLITFVLLRYKGSIRNLKKVSIWIQVILITLLAAMVWEWISTGEFFTMSGLIIGLEMNFRAMMLIFSFSALSVELRNPLVKSLLYRNGFSNLYKSITLAFATLPVIIENLPQGRSIFKQRRMAMSNVFSMAEELLSFMETEAPVHHNIYLLSGEVHSGKSTFMGQLADACLEKELTLAGFVATGTFNDDRRDSFILRDLSSDASFLLGTIEKRANWIKHRDFYFDPAAIARGEELIRTGLENKVDLIILDELGPMELAGNGWSGAIRMLEENFKIPQVWVVRKRIIKEVKDRWNIPDDNIYSLESTTFQQLLENLDQFIFAQNDR